MESISRPGVGSVLVPAARSSAATSEKGTTMHHDTTCGGADARRSRARSIFLALAAAGTLLAGCSGSQRAAPVDADRAREALKTTLDGWKKGDTPATLKDGSPPITVQDMDWMSGARLVDYQVDGEGKAVEANLYVPVKLTLKTKDGKQVKKTVSYVVGTSPILTVFRNFR
jgi:hypothetical protein